MSSLLRALGKINKLGGKEMLVTILVLQVLILLVLGGIVNKLKELLTKVETLKIENIRLLDILSEMEKNRRKEETKDEQITKERIN